MHCVIGNGVVIHLRGFLEELKSLREADVGYQGRLHISDRAHIVFDFHQLIDGYSETRLKGNKLGTTLKGIGPAYSCKTMRNGLRVGDLQDMEYFENRLRALAEQLERSYPGIEIDVEKELAYYNSIRDELLPMVTDTIEFCHRSLEKGQSILVEGANATSKLCEDIELCTFTNETNAESILLLLSAGFGLRHVSIRNIFEPLRGERLHGSGGASATGGSGAGHCEVVLHARRRGPFPHGAHRRNRRETARSGRGIRDYDRPPAPLWLDRRTATEVHYHGKRSASLTVAPPLCKRVMSTAQALLIIGALEYCLCSGEWHNRLEPHETRRVEWLRKR